MVEVPAGWCGYSNTNITVEECYNYGDVVAVSSNQHAGGLIGDQAAWMCSFYDCANFGGVDGSGSSYRCGSGGIMGRCRPNGTTVIYNTCNYGEITGKSTTSVGGIIGYLCGNSQGVEIVNVFSSGAVGDNYSKWGGLVGVNESTSTVTALNCFYISSSGSGAGFGVSLSEEELKSENFVTTLNSYIESNTDSIDTTGWSEWKAGEDGYPVHKKLEEES